MKSTYHPFIDRMINKYEGGYGWNKKDPGGPTNFGITCYDLAENRGQKMTSMAYWAPLVRTMTKREAEDIYSRKYATKLQFDFLNDGVDVCLLDYGVNSGWVRPIRVARSILSVPGPLTMTPDLVSAINKVDPEKFIRTVCVERLHFMQGIRGGDAWKEFGGGWGSRVADLYQYAIALVHRQPASSPEVIGVKSMPDAPKVTHGDPALVPTTAKGVGTGLGTAVVTQLGGFPTTTVAVIAGVVILAGIGYFMWKQGKFDRANSAVPANLKVT